jgi:hypothetical protein
MRTTINGIEFELLKTDRGTYYIYKMEPLRVAPLENPKLYGAELSGGGWFPNAEMQLNPSNSQWEFIGQEVTAELKERELALSDFIISWRPQSKK